MQGELFKVSGPVVDASKINPPQTGWMDRFHVTLRLDHLAVASILALVLYVLVFSFGVEKGKRFALAELAAEKSKQEQMTQELVQAAGAEESQTRRPRPESASAFPQNTRPPVPEAVPPAGTDEPAPSPAAGKYTIQLITFTSRPRAEQEVERLEKLGYQSFIIPAGKFFQVCVNAFEKMSEAREKLTQLQSEGFAASDAFIRPLQGKIAL